MGSNWQQKLSEFHQHYLPDVIYMGGDKEGALPLLENKLIDKKTTIYVCENKTCQLPVEEVALALKQIK